MTEAPSETWQRDRSTRIVSSWENASNSRSLWQTRAAWLDESIFFNLRGDVDSSRARTALLSSEFSKMTGQNWAWKIGGTAIRQWAQADGYADTSHWYAQTRLAGFAMTEFRLKNGRLTALLRQEWAENQAAPFTWSVGGQWDWGLRFHLSRNFNLPTFNDRFWLEYGKPDLKPEKGYSGDVGWVFQKKQFSAEITAFQLLIDDWILWQPGADGIFRPDNLRKVWSRGAEAVVRCSLFVDRWKVEFSGRYQFVKATNVEVYGGSEVALNKELPYTPNHSAGAVFRVEKNWFSMAYLQQWTGRRFTTSDNSESLKGFSTGNLLGQIFLKKAKITLDFRLENVWNAPYQIIAYRPMPGCSFRVGLSYRFGFRQD
jgi:iron complex outermembrane receptor protein